MTNPISGFAYLLKGFQWLNKKGLRRFVIIPLLINIIIFATLFGISGHFYGEFVHWLDSRLPSWLHWLNWILWPLFVISAAIFLTYAFTIIANLVSAPFNSFLSEKVELLVTGKVPNEDEGIWDALKDVPRTLGRQWTIVKYFIPRVILILILFLIPGINILAGLFWFLFSSWTLALQYFDYPMDNHRIPFPQMLKDMKKTGFRSLSFGCTVMVVTLIPVLNFFVIPAAVIGATLMYLDDRQNDGA